MERILGVVAAVIAIGFLTPVTPTHAQSGSEDSASLEQQLAAQQGKNQELQRRIAALEEVLKTDVCRNPEAAKALRDAAMTH